MFSGDTNEAKENQRNGGDRSFGVGSPQGKSFRDGYESNTTPEGDSERGYRLAEEIDPTYGVGEGDIGGIISQLRDLQQAHLAYVDAHEERLRKRLAESQEHRRKVAENMERLEQQAMRLLNEINTHQVEG